MVTLGGGTPTMDLSSVFSHKYLHELLVLGVRSDGRIPDAGRQIILNVGSVSSCDGSALVRCGGTLVACGVKVELIADSESRRRGFLVCNVELSSCSLPLAISGPPPVDVQVLTRQLQGLLQERGYGNDVRSFLQDLDIIHKHLVDVDKLYVAKCELAWVLHVDVVCLSHHGNLLDVSCLASTAALHNTGLPCIDPSDPSAPVLRVQRARTKVPFIVPSVATVSFALFDEWCLLDPVLEEEQAAQGQCTFTLSGRPLQVVRFEHQGKTLSEQQISRLKDLAGQRALSLGTLLHTAK